jgi:subtilase family serine protease
MSLGSSPRRRATALTTTVLAVAAVTLTGVVPAGAATAVPAGRTPAPAATRHGLTPAIGISPHHLRAGRPSADSAADPVQFGCQTAASAVTCYGPQQIRTAYGIDKLLAKGVNGQGRTIVIIDAYNPPNVEAELARFSTTWGLPTANFRVVNPYGAGYDETDANQQGWSGEIALDVEWAHVVAPSARIVLVTAKTNDDKDIVDAVEYAVDHRLGDVISQSYGEDERCFDKKLLPRAHAVYQRATRLGITLTASTGDQGAAQPTCDNSSYSLAASYPASDPTNLGVGGTSLTADLTTGKYGSETVWNESIPFGAAGGGGFSTIFRKPGYQYGVVPGKYRGLPDVSYNAGINGGVLTYWDPIPSATGDEGFYIFGGTSAGAPQWAGLTALAAQLRHRSLGLLNDSIYAAARNRRVQNFLFHDITTGNNTYTDVDATGTPTGLVVQGYSATPGWDAATGFGTPKADRLVPFLAATN